MPSRIEELISYHRKQAGRQVLRGVERLLHNHAADELERAYHEEVVPIVQTLRDALAWVPPCSGTDAAIKDILRRFDAPAGTEPPANPKPAAEEPRT